MATTLGLSKVFILDKYFSELQKFWETEKRLQGMEEKSYFSETGSNTTYRLNACGIHILRYSLHSLLHLQHIIMYSSTFEIDILQSTTDSAKKSVRLSKSLCKMFPGLCGLGRKGKSQKSVHKPFLTS